MSGNHGGNEPINLGPGSCGQDTKLAIRVLFDDGDVLWIPQAAVHVDSEVYKRGTTGKVIVMQWWADKQGLLRAPVTLGPAHG